MVETLNQLKRKDYVMTDLSLETQAVMIPEILDELWLHITTASSKLKTQIYQLHLCPCLLQGARYAKKCIL
ncbi:hypothetical protein Trydic_g900 [Trypoxylus dichotomus]